METNRKRWSEEEILRLREIMTRYTIDTEGCRYASQELRRPYSGVYAKWCQIKPDKKNFNAKEDDVKVLYNNISKYPGNISEAIRQTARETGRSYSNLQKAYYSTKSPYYHGKTATCFTMISKDRIASNAKNYDSVKMPKTTKQKIKQIVAKILGIRKEDL